MIVRAIDPRDSDWEIEAPRYRVYFWRNAQAHADGPRGLASEEFEIEGGDVEEVLSWAKSQANPGDSFAVYAVCPADRRAGLGDMSATVGLLCLRGRDPNANV